MATQNSDLKAWSKGGKATDNTKTANSVAASNSHDAMNIRNQGQGKSPVVKNKVNAGGRTIAGKTSIVDNRPLDNQDEPILDGLKVNR